MNAIKACLILLCAVAMTGCATVTRGTKDFFEIESEPAGATVALSNGFTCVTPCGMELPRKHSFTATFTLDGYKPLTAEVVPKQASAGTAGMAGNILIGGLIGVVADSTSGAMKDLYPNPLIAKLALESSDELSAVVFPPEDAEDKDDASEVEEPADEEEDATAEVAASAATP